MDECDLVQEIIGRNSPVCVGFGVHDSLEEPNPVHVLDKDSNEIVGIETVTTVAPTAELPLQTLPMHNDGTGSKVKKVI